MSHADPRSTADIDHRFSFHPASTPDRVAEHEKVREGCKALAHFLDELLPGGREKSLALTNLEQTVMWANAAVARQTQAGA